MSEPKYRGGCARGMPLEGACHRKCLHRANVLAYRDTRHAWEALRESNTPVDVAGGHGATIAAYQLEDEDFAAAHPPPTFKAWLIEHARGPSDD